MRYFFSILIIITTTQLFSQSWDLETCIIYALEHNIQVKQQELNTQITENTNKQSKISVLPNLNANLNRSYSFGRSVDPFTNEFNQTNAVNDNYGINSSVTLFNGFQKINSIKQTKLDMLASLQDLEKIKNDISLNVASSFLTILFNEELLKIAEDQAAVTKTQVKRTNSLVEAGSLAKGDLLQLESQYASEELNIINAQNQLDISLLTLIQLLELDSVNNFNIVKPNTNDFTYIPLPVIDEVITLSENLPQIKSAEYRLSSAEKSLSIKKGMRSPSLSLSLGYNTGYSDQRQVVDQTTMSPYISGRTANGVDVYSVQPINTYITKPFSDQIDDNRSASVGFALAIPIFNNWQVNTSINNAKISVLNSKYSLELEKNNLEKEIKQQYTEALAAKKKYNATQKALVANKEAFKYTQEKFDVGLVNSVDFNIQKNKLIKAESDLLQAKYDYIFKLKILDFYMGKPLTLN